jgi:hypothetical protein
MPQWLKDKYASAKEWVRRKHERAVAFNLGQGIAYNQWRGRARAVANAAGAAQP